MTENKSRLILKGIDRTGTFLYETHPDDMPSDEELEAAKKLLGIK